MVAATTSLTCLSLESATASLSTIGGWYEDEDGADDDEDEDDKSLMLRMSAPLSPWMLKSWPHYH